MRYLMIIILSFVLLTVGMAQVVKGYVRPDSDGSRGFIGDPKRLTPFTSIGDNIIASFSDRNAAVHLAAGLTTIILISTDVDYNVHNYFSENRQYSAWTDPAVGLGYTMPVLLGGGLYLYGKSSGRSEIAGAGCAVLQASLVTVAYVSLLKAVTGRPNPDPLAFSDMREASRTFRFGFMRGGIHYGWPSGHLATNTAAVSALLWYYPKSLPMKIAGGVYLAYLIFGVTAHDGATMHWFSDVVAGTLMGGAIGATIGSSFRQMFDREVVEPSSSRLTPVVAPEKVGMTFTLMF